MPIADDRSQEITGDASAASIPDWIGPYRLLRVLGEGGMGVVYLAEQHEPIRRQVAIKVVKPGMDTRAVIARFELERQALALMDHPAIARVYDAGATEDGRPYFVMEYVAGLPVTVYSDRWRLTLTASSSCVPAVPEDAAVRTYNATVAQTGTFLRIALTSPTFPVADDLRLDGVVIDKRLTVFLPFDDFYYAVYGLRYYSLVETLSASRVLAIAGTARGERAGAVVTGSLDGEFALYSAGGGLGVRNRQFSCTRNDHGFRLDRS
jgi:hypothetical protein